MSISLPVTIENDALRLEVWPQIGGKVASIIDRADRYDLLFSYPAELPVGSHYDQPYANSWYAGWDECFPAVAASSYVGHPYGGVRVPDHGELWGLPTQVTPARDGITCTWHGLRFGYRLSRTIHLEDATLTADYELENLAPFEFRFVWAQHALMSMSEPVELLLPQGLAMQHSHGADGESDDGGAFEWPRISGDVDFSRVADLPGQRAWKVFSREPVEYEAVVRYPSRGRRLRIEFDSPTVRAYWGIWINTGGWAGQKHFAIEPTTGRFDQIDRSIVDHSSGQVPPLSVVRWTVRWTVQAEPT
jgi:hypothetical protein